MHLATILTLPATLPTKRALLLTGAGIAPGLTGKSVCGPCADYAQSIADIPFLQLVNKWRPDFNGWTVERIATCLANASGAVAT
jgi:hypothetical protein